LLNKQKKYLYVFNIKIELYFIAKTKKVCEKNPSAKVQKKPHLNPCSNLLLPAKINK
jgi:hypothetical protein